MTEFIGGRYAGSIDHGGILEIRAFGEQDRRDFYELIDGKWRYQGSKYRDDWDVMHSEHEAQVYKANKQIGGWYEWL